MRWFAALLFLTTSLLHALDYTSDEMWVCRENAPADDKPADVFFLAPTVSASWAKNMDVKAPSERESFYNAVMSEKGLYSTYTRFFAPYYRQKSFLHYAEKEADDIAYSDVKEAFLNYLEHDNGGRPFVLAGFSQGSEHLLRLIKDVMSAPEIAERMVAAYLIGWCITQNSIEGYPQLRPAQGESDTGVFVTWNTEKPEVRTSLLVPRGVRALVINPLNWRTDDTPAPAKMNKGGHGRFLVGSSEIKSGFCGVSINTSRGTLNPCFPEEIPDPLKVNTLFGNQIYHAYEPYLYYENLRRNVGTRIQAYKVQHQ